jgi:hypothetical protein
MESPPPFPRPISPTPILKELARTIRFFLRTDKKLTPGSVKSEFDWQSIDFAPELRLGDDCGLRKRLNQKLPGDPEHFLEWRQKNNDPLVYLLEIAFIMGRLRGCARCSLTHVPNDDKRRLAERLMESTVPAAPVEDWPKLGSC